MLHTTLLLLMWADASAGGAASCSLLQLSSADSTKLLHLLLCTGVLSCPLVLASSLKSSTVSSSIRRVDCTSSLWLSPSHTRYKSSKVLHAAVHLGLLAGVDRDRAPAQHTPVEIFTLQDCFAGAAKHPLGTDHGLLVGHRSEPATACTQFQAPCQAAPSQDHTQHPITCRQAGCDAPAHL